MAAQIIAVTEVIDLLRKFETKISDAAKDNAWLSPAAYTDVMRELERLAGVSRQEMAVGCLAGSPTSIL